MLFDGLVRQSEINCLLDDLFGDLDGAALNEGEGEGVVLTLYEKGENAEHAVLLTA